MTITLDTLFVDARTRYGWTDTPVTEADIRALYDLVKMGPTSANCSPARFLFVHSPEAKAKLAALTSGANPPKVLAAPVTAIIGFDRKFYDKLPELFPHADARSWFTGSAQVAHDTAFRNSSLQGGYFIMAARALGWDAGPMSGFDKAGVDAAFWAGTDVETNFICSFGKGNDDGLFPRLPRLAFEDAAQILVTFTLALSTASPALSLALFDGATLVAHDQRSIGRGHAEALMPGIAAMMGARRAGAILVDVGPGSFTGIRIGIAAARALGLGWGVPVTGCGGGSLVAARAFALRTGLARVTVLMDAGRGMLLRQVVTADFAASPVETLTPDAVAVVAGEALAGAGVRLLPAHDGDVIHGDDPDMAFALQLPLPLRSLAPAAHYVRPPDAILPL